LYFRVMAPAQAAARRESATMTRARLTLEFLRRCAFYCVAARTYKPGPRPKPARRGA
jgi:hypothetical protein